jgi:hypothetical protein
MVVKNHGRCGGSAAVVVVGDPEDQSRDRGDHDHDDSHGAVAAAAGVPAGEALGATLRARPGNLATALLLRDHGGSLWSVATDIG